MSLEFDIFPTMKLNERVVKYMFCIDKNSTITRKQKQREIEHNEEIYG